ncbi:MAG: ABC transporter ATP-binding protein, partial [Chloroflexota bacterium]
MSQQRPEIRLAPQVGARVPMAVKGAKDARSTIKRLWGYLRHQRKYLGLVMLLVSIATLCTLALPYLVGFAIDHYISIGDLSGLARLVAVMIGIAVIYAAATWGFTLLMNRVSQYTVRDLRRDLFAKLQTLPLRFFDQRPHGELMSYLTNDVENVSVVLAENVTIFISSLLIIVGMVVIMLAINLPLAIVSLIVLPLTAYFTRYVARHTRQGFRDQQESLAMLNGHIEETITGGKVLRAFGREQAVIDEFITRNERLRG